MKQLHELQALVDSYIDGGYARGSVPAQAESLKKKLSSREDLSPEEALSLIHIITSDDETLDQKAGLLRLLSQKRCTALELAVFAIFMRRFSVSVGFSAQEGYSLHDTCGTGGDGLHLFNISTAAAFIIASLGFKVAKHGNKGITSSSGSADVLQALGARIDLSADEIKKSIEETNFGFIFAPLFHPVMKKIMPVRMHVKEKFGIPTVFNYLGPLINPAGARNHAMGVFDPAMLETIAQAMDIIGFERFAVFTGEAEGKNVDELSLSGRTRVIIKGAKGLMEKILGPGDFGLNNAPLSALRTFSASENASILLDLFSLKREGAVKDCVMMNAAFALHVFSGGGAFDGCMAKAQAAIEQGMALDTLRRFVKISKKS